MIVSSATTRAPFKSPGPQLIIAVDFDGTCVTHEYPAIGRSIGAAKVLRKLVARGHRLILYTMRSGAYLEDAEHWFADRGIPLFGSNENPEQGSWTDSPKVYAHVYIDDAALGTPLLSGISDEERPYVDWAGVSQLLTRYGVL